jgi:hypothetical protein
MEPQPTTPPDGPEPGRSWEARARAGEFDEDPLAGPWAGGEDPGETDVGGETDAGAETSSGGHGDWSARYGAPPPPPPPRSGPDFSALFILLDGLRRAAPAELQGRLTSLIREGLMTLRSLIDWYLERLDRRPPEREVEDIPIDD